MMITSHWRSSPLVALAIAALLGCQAIDDSAADERAGAGSGVRAACPVKHGRYVVSLTQVDGACEAPQIVSVPIDDNITIEKFIDTDVETETVISGCSVRLNRTERDKAEGIVRSTMTGTLTAHEEGQLAGTVSVTFFDARGGTSCQSDFGADFSAVTTIAAVAHE